MLAPSRASASTNVNDKGQPDFEALQARLRPRNGKLTGHLCYMVFDCLYVNGHSLLNRPLEERQAILWELQPALQTDEVKLTEGFPAAKSARLMKACVAMGLEGVIMKRNLRCSWKNCEPPAGRRARSAP